MVLNGRLALILISGLLVLTSCGLPSQASPQAFDALVRWVPAQSEQALFLDLRPEGEVGRHWERIRGQLEANPTGEEGLRALLEEFQAEKYGLEEWLAGPAFSGYEDGIRYAIVQVGDEAAVQDALLQQFEDETWEQQEFEGKTLYYGKTRDSWRFREQLAWTVHEGLLFLATSAVYAGQAPETLTHLQALLSQAEEDSLAALPSWQTLRRRLPENPMGLVFFNVAEQARRRPPSPTDTSLGAALGQQVEAMAAAAMPEADGMRVEIAGLIAREPDALPELQALLRSPDVDPGAWTQLPSNTAIALVGHDASVVWPWLKEIFGIGSLGLLRDTLGLDLEADLAREDGPLAGEFALAITPPLPNQPISQGLPAGQLLFLTEDASKAQAAEVQASMEGRGAIFGPGEAEGVTLQTQVGTALTGYALAYGFDGDTLLLGTSPGIISQAVAEQRRGQGLVETETFQTIMGSAPGDSSFFAYLNSRPLISLQRVNMTEEEVQNSPEWRILEVFDAIGLGLRFELDRIDGAVYFFLP